MKTEYAIVIKSKTRLELLVERFNTTAQARFYIEHSGGNWTAYVAEHERFYHVLGLVQQRLTPLIKTKVIDRQFLPSFLFNESHVVIVVGQDGLVANAAKYVNGLPIIAVNPDPACYDGVLLPFDAATCAEAVRRVVKRDYAYDETALAEACLSDGQRLLAFNDLFIGAATHISARYTINYRDTEERHSSSGIIVSTRMGATGWLSSVVNMANGLNYYWNWQTVCDHEGPVLQADQLVFVVREPFRCKTSGASIVTGCIDCGESLVLTSEMPMNGVIFSDGVESDFLQFNTGVSARIGVAKEKARLVK